MGLEMSFQEAEELLEGIINNKYLVELDSRRGRLWLMFSHPNSEEIIMSRATRAQALQEAQAAGLPTRDEIRAKIEERGIVSEEDKIRIKELESRIDAQQRLLKLTKIEARRKPIEESIARLAKEFRETEGKADNFYVLCREFRADEVALLYLTWAATYTLDGTKLWHTFQDFEKETDLLLRTSALNKFADFNKGVPTAKVRYLARHPLWRIRYTAGLKLGGSLFPQEFYDLTPDQQNLLYWSSYYQSIYEMLPSEQPDKEIIEDDEALDSFMEAYFKKQDAERNEGRLNRTARSKGKLSTNNSDEVIMTANNPQYLNMAYSQKRVSAPEGASEVEVIAPNSRRARNRRAARRNRG